MRKKQQKGLEEPRLAHANGAHRLCDFPDCVAAGEYRAPKSREPRDGYHLFCLDHVRRYNAAWDFFAGMSNDEIQAYQRSDCTGHRPTWRLGIKPGEAFAGFWVRDDMGLLGELGWTPDGFRPAPPEPADPSERNALAVLDLKPSVSLADIKTRYKELAKRYHPDANGGDKTAEEQLKTINQAYNYLLSCGYS